MKLKNKVALITGATGVIGKAIAHFFAKEGCILILSGRSSEKLELLKQEFEQYKDSVVFQKADVSKKEDVLQLIKKVEQEYGRLDILVTAAGTYGCIGSIEQCEPEEWERGFRVNLLGTMMCIKYSLPILKNSSNAKIITFAGGGEKPLPNFTSYITSKAGVLRLTETLADELSGHGVLINAISPGAIDSGLQQDLINYGEERAGKKMYNWALHDLKETGQSPDKAAELAVFLASEESNGLTGRNISAIWDNWKEIPKHLEKITGSDIYTARRIKPKDRGYGW